jgi:hypothetical protein
MYAFRNALNVVVSDRPLEGEEVLIFDTLERWEASGLSGRPGIVDQLRTLVAATLNAAENDRLT